MDLLTCDDFVPRLDAEFVMVDGDDRVPLRLTEAVAVPVKGVASVTRPPFSLLFKSAEQQVREQRIHRLVQAEMGELDIFLVPIARDAEGVTYEAVFS